MRSSILSALALALFVGILGTVGVAQTGALPAGDYQQTCRDIKANGSQLTASCKKKDGSFQNTSIDTSSCTGNIANEDGQLRCTGSSTGQGQALPAGSYQQTCKNIRVNGNDLEASCQKTDGSFQNTTLKNANSCNQIVNENGNLRCQ
jgi:hypothetical protein